MRKLPPSDAELLAAAKRYHPTHWSTATLEVLVELNKPSGTPGVLSRAEIEALQAKLESWEDSNPHKAELARHLARLGGKHRPVG